MAFLAALAMVAINSPAPAGDQVGTGGRLDAEGDNYFVERDARGLRVGTVECNPTIGECVSRDTRGRRTGATYFPPDDTPTGPTLEEIIEQEHRDEGLER